MHFFKKLFKLFLILALIVFIAVMIPLGKGLYHCPLSSMPLPLATIDLLPIPASIQQAQASIADYQLPVSSTYLIFPEWYIVYSSQEYANFLNDKRPSQFPYFASIEQYWSSYCTVYKLAKPYPYNAGDNLMLMVIGISFSVEYAIKGLYENTIGHFTEWLSNDEQTPEDNYQQHVAQQYAEFIPVWPWFEFSFSHAFKGLWTDTSYYGPHMTRKWERKFILSTEYGIKTIYSWIIAQASHATLGTAPPIINAAMTNIQPSFFTTNSRIKNSKYLGKNTYLVTIPTEQPFTDTVKKLAGNSARFIDIAGNQIIFLTAIAPATWHQTLTYGQILFTMNILTRSAQQRIAIQVPVADLIPLLTQLQVSGARIEHIYDY